MAEGTKLGERLVQAGLIAPEAVAQALELQRRTGARIGECLVELRLLSEQALLRFLASELGTRYVSWEKLAKVKVEPDVLDRVPVRMAEKMGVLPIAFETERKILSVVMAEPQNIELVTELKVLAGAEDVVTFIALRSAINAGVKKFYYGDPSAFSVAPTGTGPPSREVAAVSDAYEKQKSGETRSVQPGDLPMEPSNPGQNQSSISAMASGGGAVAVSGVQPTSVRRAMDAIQRSSAVTDNDYVETLNVLVSLLEMQGRMRGHSARVAKQARTVAQRLGAVARDVNFVTIAAYLHELGKTGGHTTLLTCAMSDEQKTIARKYVRAPLKLFESVHLPPQVSTILVQLYEAFDGSGLTPGIKGTDIAEGARILAAVDSYEDLISNPDNQLGGVASKGDALKTIETQTGKLFDPAVIEVLRQISTGEILRQRVEADGHQVLLAEPDGPVRVGLTRALAAAGLTVHAVVNSELALQHASQGDADLVIASTSLQPDDAFVLTAELRQEPLTAGLPVLLLAESDDPKMLDRAGQLGVAGILLKPVDEEQLASQCKTLLEERLAAGAPHRHVSGSLDELGIVDLLKIMSSRARSGQLVVRNDQEKGELYLERGRLVHGVVGPSKGRDAVAKMLSWKSGDFRLDPNFLILEQQVDLDVAALLRELAPRERPT